MKGRDLHVSDGVAYPGNLLYSSLRLLVLLLSADLDPSTILRCVTSGFSSSDELCHGEVLCKRDAARKTMSFVGGSEMRRSLGRLTLWNKPQQVVRGGLPAAELALLCTQPMRMVG